MVARGIGQTLITAGLVVLLFVVYEVYVTDIFGHEKQEKATAAMDQQWSQQAGPTTVAAADRGQQRGRHPGRHGRPTRTSWWPTRALASATTRPSTARVSPRSTSRPSAPDYVVHDHRGHVHR